MTRRLPVTLVGGFLGAGKTSLLHHIISEHQGGHLAMLVENPGALNLDAQALRGLCGAMRRTQDAVFEIPDGNEMAQAQAIANTLRDLALAERYERVLIEVAGTASPSWLTEHFLDEGVCHEWGQLEQIVCVVDALDYFHTAQGPASADAMWAFQNEQLKGATLIVLNKGDLLSDADRKLCLGALQEAHGDCPVIPTEYGEVSAEIWTMPASSEELAMASRHPALSLAELPPLSSALYRVHRPFHPARFWDWFNADHPGLLRVKGLIWLATRNLLVGGVSRTRRQNSCGAAGIWWAALPREEWPESPEALRRMQETWQEPYGDRHQELVLIGEAVSLSGPLRRELDASLLTDAEMARPPQEWSAFPDPFPEWDF